MYCSFSGNYSVLLFIYYFLIIVYFVCNSHKQRGCGDIVWYGVVCKYGLLFVCKLAKEERRMWTVLYKFYLLRCKLIQAVCSTRGPCNFIFYKANSITCPQSWPSCQLPNQIWISPFFLFKFIFYFFPLSTKRRRILTRFWCSNSWLLLQFHVLSLIIVLLVLRVELHVNVLIAFQVENIYTMFYFYNLLMMNSLHISG